MINEAINLKKSAIFVAVPKTGTTTVRRQFKTRGVKQWLVPQPHLNIMQIRDALDVYYLLQSMSCNKHFPTKDNVQTYQQSKAAARDAFASFFKFSSVRNPWERAVSLYFRREGVQVSSPMTFRAFCEQHTYASDTCRHPTLHRNQLDWLVDEEGTILMDYVYKLSDHEQAFADIREMTNGRIVLSSDKRSNVNPKSKSSNYRDIYDDHTKRIIGKNFEKDIDYFKFEF